MLKINIDKGTVIKFDIVIVGSTISELTGYFRFIHNGTEYGFPTTIKASK